MEIAPTAARVNYSVKSGEQCYVEIYNDSTEPTPAMLNGPVEETVEVVGTWTITTWSADTISVSVDGQPVQLTSSADYGGMYAYTVDFAKILEEWNSTHNSKTSQRQAAVATANAAAQQASESEDESSSSSSSSASESAEGNGQAN